MDRIGQHNPRMVNLSATRPQRQLSGCQVHEPGRDVVTV